MSVASLLEFFRLIGKLKRVKRSGWVSHVRITRPESVADHSFSCAVLAMCIGDLVGVDTDKLIRMLLLHDLQESLTGDYNSSMKEEIGILKAKELERAAIMDVLSVLPLNLKTQYLSLWEEYVNKTTREAVLAQDIDKIEMLVQALEYEEDGYNAGRLEAFWTSVQDRIETPILRRLVQLLKEKRPRERVR